MNKSVTSTKTETMNENSQQRKLRDKIVSQLNSIKHLEKS